MTSPQEPQTAGPLTLSAPTAADLMTKGEHNLIRDGRGDLVLETRRAYQDAMGDELSAGVENITGRKVIAFLSANHLDPDIAIESFMLAPGDG